MLFNTIFFLIAMMGLRSGALENATDDIGTYSGLPSKGPGLLVASIVGVCCCVFLVVNRLVWRFKLSGGVGYDDWAIFWALIFYICQSSFCLVSISYGYGDALVDAHSNELKRALLYFYLLQVFYVITINLVKMSILCLYIRLFAAPYLRWTALTFLSLTFTALLAFMIPTILQCHPRLSCIKRPWSYPRSQYLNVELLWKATTVYNIVSDVFLLALPIPALRHMHAVPHRRRVELFVAFSLGVVVTAVATVRFTTLGRAARGEEDLLTDSYDASFWTQVESALAVACPCLPMVRQLLEVCLVRWRRGPRAAMAGVERSLGWDTLAEEGNGEGGEGEAAGEEGRELDEMEVVKGELPAVPADALLPVERIGRAF